MNIATKLMAAILFILSIQMQAQTVSTVAGPGINIDDAIIKAADGTIYGVRYTGSFIYKVTPGGEVSEYMGGFNTPNGLAFDADSNLVVCDNQGNRIYKVMPDSTKVQFGPNLSLPSGIIKDPQSDTLYVTQYNPNRIIKLSPDGMITPFLTGGGLNGPVGLAFDENNTLYTANYSDGRVFRIEGDSLHEIADIPGTTFGAVGFLAYGGGKLYATSIGVHRVYEIDPVTETTTILAGTGTAGLLDGPADQAQFNRPNGILFDPADNSIYVSDFQTRTLRKITGVVTGISHESSTGHIEAFHLHQNYPNPFNPSTTIRFRLPHAENVTLALYDIRGRQIATLLQEKLPAGEHRLNFDAENLASGVYLYRIEAGGFKASRKMALIR